MSWSSQQESLKAFKSFIVTLKEKVNELLLYLLELNTFETYQV